MQKTLLRQLKRSFNVGDEAELNTWLANMQTAAKADPSLRGLLDGFGDFIERVGSSYEQYERDLDLRTRSLEISSAELSGSNEKLRRELIDQRTLLLECCRNGLRGPVLLIGGGAGVGVEQVIYFLIGCHPAVVLKDAIEHGLRSFDAPVVKKHLRLLASGARRCEVKRHVFAGN